MNGLYLFFQRPRAPFVKVLHARRVVVCQTILFPKDLNVNARQLGLELSANLVIFHLYKIVPKISIFTSLIFFYILVYCEIAFDK